MPSADGRTGGAPGDATGVAAKALPRTLFLCEGNAETHDSWSGVSRSVVMHLRALGHRVLVGDADLYGAARLRVALRTVSWPRKRWWVRYHLHGSAFKARSAACARILSRLGDQADVLLQVGATFVPPDDDPHPLVLYCDSNVEMSRRGAESGQSEGAMLTARELDAVRAREARVYERASLIFTMSERARRSFIDDFGIAADRLVTVHCGPNNELPPPDARGSDGRQGPPTVLFVGRDFARKGGPLLLESFERVRRSIPTARLCVVGGRPERRAEIPGVEFLGFLSRDGAAGREAMDLAYRSASVFCVPTRFEPFGTSFIEAMTYGLPCVGPAIWAVPEIIDDGRTGYLVPPEDVGALSDALVRVLSDPARAVTMGEAARLRVEEHFTWGAVARRMSDGLRRVVRESRRPVSGDAPVA